MDENVLLTELKGGSRSAFEKLYGNYANKLMVKLLFLVKSEEVAKDLLQDIFMKIWQMRAEIDPTRSFGALLYRMSSNLSYNAYRSAVRQEGRLKEVCAGDSYSHIEEQVEFQETSKLLDMALAELSERQRSIYVLHRLEGKSYKEIGEVIGISHSAINQNLQIANKHIRTYMQSRLPQLLIFLIPYFL